MSILLKDASQGELSTMLITTDVTIVRSVDLQTLPIGAIVRLKTLHHTKYLLQVDELKGKRAVHVILSDKTGSVGSAKYRGLHVVRPEYMTVKVGEQFKYENILTTILAEIDLLP